MTLDREGDGVLCRKLKEEMVETDGESTAGSSEDMESSPRSVVVLNKRRKWRGYNKKVQKKDVCVHSQILRIREEESLIGEDVADTLNDVVDHCNDDTTKLTCDNIDQHFNVMLRPVRPASPLSGKK